MQFSSVFRVSLKSTILRSGGLLGSSFFRLAMIYALVFSFSVLLLLGFIYWATAIYMSSQADELINVEIQGLAEQYRQRGLTGLTEVMRERLRRNPESGMLYLFAGSNYQALAGNLSHWPQVGEDEQGWIDFRLEHRRDPQGFSRLARARLFRLPKGLHLLVGRDVHELESIRQLLVRALIWGMILTVGLGILGGIACSASVARRLETMNQTSRRIMAGEIHRRIPVRGTGDDFDQLAENLNAMLDRIEQLMEGIRQISDNVAHDLKTPLTRLKYHLERADKAEGATDPTCLSEAIAEADRLLLIFNALLKIARVESDQSGQFTHRVDLSQVLGDVVELYEPLAQEKAVGMKVQVAGSIEVPGNRDLLFQCLANLLDNSLKFTPAGGVVHVSLSKMLDKEVAEIYIADSGPGIVADERARVFRRFYRIESSRQTPGHGLGLSLVAAVITHHQGEVWLNDNDPGLKVCLHFPLYLVAQ